MFNYLHTLLFIIIFFNYSILNASHYDDDLLNVFSKILPRFVLMSSQKGKLQDSIEICVINEKLDEHTSKSLLNKTNLNYPNGLSGYKIKFINTSFLNIDICKTASLAFVFNSSDKNINNLLNFLNENKILTIAYDQKVLKNGADISLFIGRKIVPYINVKTLNKKGIVLNNILLRISKIYSKEED